MHGLFLILHNSSRGHRHHQLNQAQGHLAQLLLALGGLLSLSLAHGLWVWRANAEKFCENYDNEETTGKWELYKKEEGKYWQTTWHII